jgi:hypothetical protein
MSREPVALDLLHPTDVLLLQIGINWYLKLNVPVASTQHTGTWDTQVPYGTYSEF